MGHGITRERIILREAIPEDSADILRWRNDDQTRQNSFDSHLISKKEHEAWYKSVLQNPQRALLIGLGETGEKIGVVIFKIEKEEAEININLAPHKRSQGLGQSMIRQAIQHLARQEQKYHIFAQIKPDNQASIRAFEKAGFRIKSSKSDRVILTLTSR